MCTFQHSASMTAKSLSNSMFDHKIDLLATTLTNGKDTVYIRVYKHVCVHRSIM